MMMKNTKPSGNSIILNELKFKNEKDIENAVINYQPFPDVVFYDAKFNLNPRGYFQRRADLIVISSNNDYWGIVEVETGGPLSKFKNHISVQIKEQSSLIDYNWMYYPEILMKKFSYIFEKHRSLILYNKPFHFLLSDYIQNEQFNTLFDLNSLVLQRFSDFDNNIGFTVNSFFGIGIKQKLCIVYSNGVDLLVPNPYLIGIELNKELIITYNGKTRRGMFIADSNNPSIRLYESGVVFFDKDNSQNYKAGKYYLILIGVNHFELSIFEKWKI